MCRDTGIDLKCRKERKGYLFAWGVDNKHQSSRCARRSRNTAAPRRPNGSLLEKPGFIDHQHGVGRRPGAQPHNRGTVAHLVLVPAACDRTRGCATGGGPRPLGQLPAVLALGRADSPSRYRSAWRRGSGRPNKSPARRCNSANGSRHPASPAGFNTSPIPNQNLGQPPSSLTMRMATAPQD